MDISSISFLTNEPIESISILQYKDDQRQMSKEK
ncbi:hypothetical protein Patl1_26453 [Pistacia atlantica]|uniref:Uncharacterized protein n=1 Tax=Pistacia atlantica TaxID=434234 RepID=A0ACC1B312_9ROSI|nr:hypothetical protein Patl1_26453 [Pistacia atlantica]